MNQESNGMLSAQEFGNHARTLSLSEGAIAVIEQIRSSGPSRVVQSGAGNVHGRYASRKMGITIQFESHHVELSAIYELEHDDQVLEFFDQPQAIKLSYLDSTGKRRAHWHTPDFFVLRKDGAGYEECKTEDRLLELEKKNPNRYCRDKNGEWRSPAGEESAAQFGLYYRVRSSDKINWNFQRNMRFLEDYYKADVRLVSEQASVAVRDAVSTEQGIKLTDLFHTVGTSATRDDIFSLIATEAVYVNLYAAPLAEAEQVQVFSSYEAAVALGLMIEAKTGADAESPQVVELAVGNSVKWNGSVWSIVNVGNNEVSLLDANQKLIELPLTTFETLVGEGKVTGILNEENATHPFVTQAFKEASEQDLAIATKRYSIVRSVLGGDSIKDVSQTLVFSQRTICRYVRQYMAAAKDYNCGYAGLLPRTKDRGYRGSKLPLATQNEISHFIEYDYQTLKQKTMYAVWTALVRACAKKNIPAPSYKTFAKAIRGVDRHKQTLKRRGRRAAYQEQAFYWLLDPRTPRHGDRPLEIVHIDHTELDVESPNSQTGRSMGRPWLSIMIDAYSRRVLAVYITFDPPSYRSCMMLLRECVRRHKRFPQTIVVDGGAEFQSTYFETLLARYECTKKVRPPAQPRFGSICERLFDTTNTQFIHNLRGNTQLMKEVRHVTISVNPKQHLTWPLKELYECLCNYVYEVYDTLDHASLGQTPREAYQAGLIKSGIRAHRFIPFDETFRMATLPTTPKGTAKILPGRGVKIKRLLYWSDSFRNPLVENTQVRIRYDPFNTGIAYAFVSGKWVECYSEYYSIFAGKSEKELMFATKELRKKLSQSTEKFTLTAKRLADFLQSVEADEALLMQRQRDREARSILESMGVTAVVESQPHLSTTTTDERVAKSPTIREFVPQTYGEFR
jgi:transposase InsO family protein